MKKTILAGHNTVDGAGVKLFRVFAHDSTKLTDPFLLLDNFGSDDPKDYIKGFPWHPHRGIETVTYMLSGKVEHGDSLGNKGVISSGDIQWMSAGSGIIHQEMPKPVNGMMQGFQLWVNMPAKKKMTTPRYRGITKDEIPVFKKKGLEIKVISGVYDGKKGPVKDLIVDVEYFDITLKEDKFSYDIKKGYTTFCYVMEGEGNFDGTLIQKGQLILVHDASRLLIDSKNARFILVSGKPLNEPIAWGGPIVMNTEVELRLAFKELHEGTFIK